MLDGELVAFLTIVGGGLLSGLYYLFIGMKCRRWILGIDTGLSILGNCFTLIPAAYFLIGVIVELAGHLLWRGEAPVIPISGNEPTLVLVFSYAVFLCVGSNFRIFRSAAGAAI